MSAVAVTYTFSNSTTADATQVNQNFADLVAGLSDGTKDISVNGGTFAGNVSISGNTTIGNASGDDLNVTGSLASSIPIKTTATYDLGASSFGMRAIYFGANSQTVNIRGSASMSATWTFTLPVTAGTDKYFLQTNGSGVTAWTPSASFADAQFNDYAGYGSTATKIPYFTNTTVSNTNSIFTITNDSTDGCRITFTKAAIVFASFGFYASAGAQIGISLNGAVTTNIYTDTDAHRKAFAQNYTTSPSYANAASAAFVVAVNDIVRPHTDGTVSGDPNSCFFSIAALSIV